VNAMTKPRSPYRHGTLTMRRRGECRTDPCDACRDVGNAYSRRNVRMRELGIVQLVDAERARQHVRRLLAAGMTVRQVEGASGVHRTAIRVLLGDFPNRKPSRRIRPDTERALLTVRVAFFPAGGEMVDGAGTRRRLQALMAIGWTARDLGRMLGAQSCQLQVGKRSQVRADTARKVAALYAELENTPGPSSRTRTWARGRGYLLPAWWDADTIDDPHAEPDGLRLYGTRRQQRDGVRIIAEVLVDDLTAPRQARVELMHRRGLSPQQIAERLGLPLRYVNRDLKEAT